jgi:hypothetical protein
MAYVRSTDKRRLLVVLNISAKPKCFSMSDLQCRGSMLLSTYLDRSQQMLHDKLALRPNEGAIIELL